MLKYQPNQWHNYDTIYFRISKSFKPQQNILAFDFDHTLFHTASGKTFPQNKKDIVPCIISWDKINDFSDHCVVIISNQAGVGKKCTLEDVQFRLTLGLTLLEKENIPSITIFSTKFDWYRKPHTYMWRFILNLLNLDTTYLNNQRIKIVNRNYLYIGDAAGRPQNKKGQNFSASDLMFAHNCRIKFMTPEEFQSDQKTSYTILYSSKIYPIRKWTKEYQEKKMDIDFNKLPKCTTMFMMVGFSGSGKTTLATNLSGQFGYAIVSQDQLSKAKCRKQINQYLSENTSVVVDNMHGTIKQRKEYISIAKNYNIPVIILWLDIPIDLAFHLSNMRMELTNTKIIPKVVNYKFNKNFECPNISEGISQIIKVPFHLKIISQFLMEY